MKALAQNESPTIREMLVEELASNSLERHDGIELTDDPHHFLNEGYFLPDQILEQKNEKVKIISFDKLLRFLFFTSTNYLH